MQQPEGLKILNIGSRGSPLALVQAHLVQRLIGESVSLAPSEYDARLPIHIFKTTGDKLTGRLSESGGKGLFVKELDEALALGHIDLAVHSMKDVPTTLDDIFTLSAILEREDPRDAFISMKYKSLDDLPKGGVLGTASLRRQAQAARVRPDLKMVLLRGNVGTRLERLSNDVCDATFLAVAGLKRLGQTEHITEHISTDVMLPAPAQGAVGVQIRAEDTRTAACLVPLHHAPSALCITAERAFLKALDGSCRTPVAALAEIDGTSFRLRGQALSEDGSAVFDEDETITLDEALDSVDAQHIVSVLGKTLGTRIKERGGDAIIWSV